MAFGDRTSRWESPVVANTSIHDLVNRILAQITPSAHVEDSSYDFVQHKPLVESYVSTPVPSHLTHLKIETYDGPADFTQHIMRFLDACKGHHQVLRVEKDMERQLLLLIVASIIILGCPLG